MARMRAGPRQARTTTRQWCCRVRGDAAMPWYQRQRRTNAPRCTVEYGASSTGGSARDAGLSRPMPSSSSVGSRARVLTMARRITQSVVTRVSSCSSRDIRRSSRHPWRFLIVDGDAPYAMRNAARNGRRNWCSPLSATYSSGVTPKIHTFLVKKEGKGSGFI